MFPGLRGLTASLSTPDRSVQAIGVRSVQGILEDVWKLRPRTVGREHPTFVNPPLETPYSNGPHPKSLSQ
ncbi:MAG: hypothetical protein ACO4CG_12210, partial [Prochlorothrix sp.]